MEPPAKLIEFLPSTPAKWVLWLSLFLSGSLYALLQYLQVDTLLPLAQAQKLSMLLPSVLLLLIGAYLMVFFVVRAYNKKTVVVTITDFSSPHQDNPADCYPDETNDH